MPGGERSVHVLVLVDAWVLTCDDCEFGYWGPACARQCAGGACTPCSNHSSCSQGRNGTGECMCHGTAALGFWQGDDCTDCQPGYYGIACTAECPGGHATPCTGHGLCSDGPLGTGQCACQTAPGTWGDEDCRTCAAGYFGADIIGLQCVVECFKPHLTCGITKTLVLKIPKNSGSTPIVRVGGGVHLKGWASAAFTWNRAVLGRTGCGRTPKTKVCGGSKMLRMLCGPSTTLSLLQLDGRRKTGSNCGMSRHIFKEKGLLLIYEHRRNNQCWSLSRLHHIGPAKYSACRNYVHVPLHRQCVLFVMCACKDP